MVYLDHAAATPPSQAATDAFLDSQREEWANSASRHKPGAAAAAALTEARQTLAELMGVTAEGLVFVSCGTEGNNMAIKSAAALQGRRGGHIVSTTLEHASVRECLRHLAGQGIDVTFVPPDKSGRVSAGALISACGPSTFLVCCCRVCPEQGAVLPADELKAALPDVLVHCDNAQGFLRVPLRPAETGIDFCVVSGHKIGAPKGIAAVWVRPGVRAQPLLHGGGHESGLRSGTVNVPLCRAFAAAARDFRPPSPDVKQYAERVLGALPGVRLIPPADAPHILAFALPGCPAEAAARMLSDMDICVSAGAACTKGGKSEALMSQKLPPAVTAGALRASFAASTTRADIDALACGLKAIVERIN
jgi:cysteine desulfurase